MGQDWKTLGAVGAGAAVAGWLVVRLLAGPAAETASRPALERGTAPATARTTTASDASADTAAAPAREQPAPVDASEPEGGGDETAIIERDLALLAEALRQDDRIEDHVMPRVNDALGVPGVIGYRRPADFWQPAFAAVVEPRP